MEKYLIFKVILFSYKHFEEKCDRIDADVKKIAISTANGVSTFKAFDKITKLMNEKRVYCNLKVIIEDVLDQMANKDVLILSIVKGLSIEEIVKITGYDNTKIYSILWSQTRSFYRLIIKKHCAVELINLVSDSKSLFDKYKQEVKKYRARGVEKCK